MSVKKRNLTWGDRKIEVEKMWLPGKIFGGSGVQSQLSKMLLVGETKKMVWSWLKLLGKTSGGSGEQPQPTGLLLVVCF